MNIVYVWKSNVVVMLLTLGVKNGFFLIHIVLSKTY